MDCEQARSHLLDAQRGRLPREDRDELRAHLAGCPGCAREAAAEEVLSDLIEKHLPRYPASPALKRTLAARWDVAPARRESWWSRWDSAWARRLAPAAALATVLIAAFPFYVAELARHGTDGGERMVAEAVNDHLRVVADGHVLGVESGGIHQVKPWFTGRLDFAPAVSFEGDEDFPLKGGDVGYFLDRKAAVFVFGRRLHTVSLFVFPADGLPWPAADSRPSGEAKSFEATARGFNLILWRAGGLGYALVSDVDPKDLAHLAAKLRG